MSLRGFNPRQFTRAGHFHGMLHIGGIECRCVAGTGNAADHHLAAAIEIDFIEPAVHMMFLSVLCANLGAAPLKTDWVRLGKVVVIGVKAIVILHHRLAWLGPCRRYELLLGQIICSTVLYHCKYLYYRKYEKS